MGKAKLAVLITLGIIWGILTYGLDWFFLDVNMVTSTFATTYTQIGILLAITAFINAVVMLPSGRIADRLGRKPVVIVSFLALGICYFSYVFALSYAPLLVLYIVGSIRMVFAATAWVALLAWVADNSSEKNRGSIMAGLTAALTVANIAALGVIGALYAGAGAYMTFVTVAVVQLIAVVPLFFIFQTRGVSPDKKQKLVKAPKGEKLRTWREVVHDRPLMLIGISAMLATAPGILIQTVIIPYLESGYGWTLVDTTVPLAFMLLFTGVGYGLAAYIIDKLKIKRGLLIGSLVVSIVPLLLLFFAAYLPFMQNIVALVIAFGVFGLSVGASTPTFLAIMADLAPSGEMGTEMGVFQGVLNFNYVIGRGLGGYLWDAGGLPSAMLGSTGLVIVALILIVGVVRRSVFEARGGRSKEEMRE